MQLTIMLGLNFFYEILLIVLKKNNQSNWKFCSFYDKMFFSRYLERVYIILID